MRDQNQKILAATLSCIVVGAAVAPAVGREFDFKDPKGVNTVAFVLDSVLEPIMGLANGISGKVEFDPAQAAKIAGRIVIQAKSVRPAHKGMVRVLHSADWLDVAHYPKIDFTFDRVESSKKLDDHTWAMGLVGAFTCKGVTKEMTIPVTVAYLAGRLGQRMHNKKKGDLLVLRAKFVIKRSDFNIKPGIGSEAVAEDIEIRVSIVGSALAE